MRTFKLSKWITGIGCICTIGLVTPADALVLTFNHVSFLGQVGHGREESATINQLAQMAPGSSAGVYVRSDNRFGSLPEAGFEFNGRNRSTGIVLDGSYDYLLVRYGAATMVWYVSGLSGSFDLPAKYNGKRAVSHYSLFRGGALAAAPLAPNGAAINDSGTTLALLGLSLTSLALVGAWLRKSQASPTQ